MPKINMSAAFRVCAAAAILTLAALVSTAFTAPAAAQRKGLPINFVNEYAVKFLCGPMEPLDEPMPPVLKGFYLTAVNIHNPGAATVIHRKVAVAGAGVAGRVTSFAATPLKNDEAVEFDCREILVQAGMPRTIFVTGFLVIRVSSPRELDVVAVYTASQQERAGMTLETERVPARRVAVPFTFPDGPGSKGN